MWISKWCAGAILVALTASAAEAQARLPRIPADTLTPEQREAIEAYKAARQAPDISGPFIPMLWSPDIMTRTRAMGDYLRYKSAFSPRLSEFIILVTARHWTQQYEWSVHYPIAVQAGVDRPIADAIAAGRRPERMAEDQEILYDLVTELNQNKSVSDATYTRALAKFGEKGVVDAVSITGYYTLLAMVLNTARFPVEAGAPTLTPLPR